MSAARYTVRRNNWQPVFAHYDGAPAGGVLAEYVRLPGDDSVAGFWTAFEADRLRDRLEQFERNRLGNPFRASADLSTLTSLPEFALADWVQDVGLSPPSARADGTRNWAVWWDDRRKFWPPAHVERVWAGLDRLRFFTVTERPLERTAFVAVEPLWGRVCPPGADPDFWHQEEYRRQTAPDGGRPVRVFRTEEDAAAFTALMAEPANRPAVWWGNRWVPRRWVEPPDSGADWHELVEVRWHQCPPGRVHEVEYDDTGGPPGEPAFAVCRLGWWQLADRWGRRFAADTAGDGVRRMVPLAVFTQREEAGRRAAELDAEVSAAFRPFDFEGGVRDFEELHRRLTAAGIGYEPPPRLLEGCDVTVGDVRAADAHQLAAWWDGRLPRWSEADRLAVWRAVGPPLHAVIPLPLDGW